MASEADNGLLRAGVEGFSSLEGNQRAKRPAARNPPQPNNLENKAPAATINSKEAAQRYGGMVIEPVITSDKAAQRYGGIVIGPAITSDQAVQLYGGVIIRDLPKNQKTASLGF